MKELDLELLKLGQKITKEKIKKEDTEFINIVEKYESVLQEFDAYLSRYINDREKLYTLNTHLIGLSFALNIIIEKYQDYLEKSLLKEGE